MITSRERVRKALAHQETDRLPVDMGGSAVTGVHARVVYLLRQSLGLDPPGTPVKVIEPYQMLGEVAPDLMDALGIDVTALLPPTTMFGFRNEGWKEWTTFDGTPVLVPEMFNTTIESNGDLLQYPDGNKSVPASGRMPKGGFYFDSIIRQPPIDEATLSVEDNLEEFKPISAKNLAYFESEAERLYTTTDKAILACFGGTAFGDIALVPAPWLENPRGIRDIEEWYISLHTRQDFLIELFDRQCEIALSNLAKIHGVVGDKVDAVFLTGTDFGTQRGPFLSADTYVKLFQPVHRRVNDWVHENTSWKAFIHSCGGVFPLLEHFVESGFDILNPVQCSAKEMDPTTLKERFGAQLTFWGGGVDTQKTLPFGTPEEVREEVRQRVATFGRDGGFVFNTVHNIQPDSPVENVLALFRAVAERNPAG
jgi:hypothetical protein